MSAFLTALRKMPHFTCKGSATNEEISLAEEELGLKFAQEYRDYLAECGFASCLGHEFTGICTSKRLSVVETTRSEREKNVQVMNNMYVIEQTNMDGIIIWQDSSGTVFQTSPGKQPIQLCKSLEEYMRMY